MWHTRNTAQSTPKLARHLWRQVLATALQPALSWTCYPRYLAQVFRSLTLWPIHQSDVGTFHSQRVSRLPYYRPYSFKHVPIRFDVVMQFVGLTTQLASGQYHHFSLVVFGQSSLFYSVSKLHQFAVAFRYSVSRCFRLYRYQIIFIRLYSVLPFILVKDQHDEKNKVKKKDL